MNGFSVLIVEDDHSIGSILQTILEEEGYNTNWIQDGQRLLEEVKGADLLIMDIMLPGENGYELSKKLQRCIHCLRFFSLQEAISIANCKAYH